MTFHKRSIPEPAIPYVESVFQPGGVPESEPSSSLLQRGVIRARAVSRRGN
jgi:hypothetical protein